MEKPMYRIVPMTPHTTKSIQSGTCAVVFPS